MSIYRNHLPIMGASGQSTGPYQINQSIRFDQSENAYLKRTPSSAGNRRTWTWSGWLKHSDQSTNGYHNIWSVRSGATDYFEIAKLVNNNASSTVNVMDIISKVSNSTILRLVSNRDFRDHSAWYHYVFVLDTTNSTSSERVRFYVNGLRETTFSTETYPAQNHDTYVNTTNEHQIGAYNGGSGYMMDGYMAEINFIDGYAYGPEYFGEFNASNIWIPKEYTGTYGTNGFYITGETDSDLGANKASGNTFATYASSGMGTHDKVLDSPTNNFVTLNPMDADGLTHGELTGGMLEITGSQVDYIRQTVPFPTSGKWYWEVCTVSKTQGNWNYGNHTFLDVISERGTETDYVRTNWYHGSNFASSSNWTDGDFWTNSNAASDGDVFGFAWDSDNKKLWLAKNNTYYGSGNPAANSGTPLASGGTAGMEYTVEMYTALSQVMTMNYGQDSSFNGAKTRQNNSDDNDVGDFYYAPPTGFLALCTKNLGAE